MSGITLENMIGIQNIQLEVATIEDKLRASSKMVWSSINEAHECNNEEK